MYRILRLGVHNRDWQAGKQPQRYQPSFVVDVSVVVETMRVCLKDLPDVAEIELVDAQIVQALPLVPRKPYMRSVYTLGQTINPSTLEAPGHRVQRLERPLVEASRLE